MGMPRLSGAQRARPGTNLKEMDRAASPPHDACEDFGNVFIIMYYFSVILLPLSSGSSLLPPLIEAPLLWCRSHIVLGMS